MSTPCCPEDYVEIASAAYPDDAVARAFRGSKTGDVLAEFIGLEIARVWDGARTTQENLVMMVKAIARAEENLDAVRKALMDALAEEVGY
jgi:hypothetical protein